MVSEWRKQLKPTQKVYESKRAGLRRTNDDKQRAVKAALAHPKAAGMSDGSIARHVGVHHDTVREWRKKLSRILRIPKDASAPHDGTAGGVISTGSSGERMAPTNRAPFSLYLCSDFGSNADRHSP